MPTLWKTCNHPGCARRIKQGSDCPVHKKKAWSNNDKRKNSKQRGYGSGWVKVRKVKLMMNPLCECGCGRIADTVHHKKAISHFPELRLTFSNLMSMTRDCHEKLHGRRR